MRISQQTIQHFAVKGISVRWYPQQTFDEFRQEQWQKQYERWFNYSKSSCKELNPNKEWVAKWDYETRTEYEEHIKAFCDRIIDRHCGPYEFDKLYIEYDGKVIIKKESVKSKVITSEYIQKLIDKNEKAYKGAYGQFALQMQALLKENKLNSISVCPTTYGIGVWVIYNWNADEQVQKVAKILKEKGVEFYNEYSEAGWVYRFKVSKKADNLAKIC